MEYFVLGIWSLTEAVSRGYFTNVLVTVNAPPEKNPDIVSSNCSSFLLSFDSVVVAISVATADAVDGGEMSVDVAFAGKGTEAIRAAADNDDKNDDRDISRPILSVSSSLPL